MKVKMSVIILVLFSCVVFFTGWVQLAVPAGKYGVLVSKTGGVNSVPITPGSFRWQWERLLPTNTSILVFDLSPAIVTSSSSGTLPSGELYSKMLEGDPDFSWNIGVRITGRVNPSQLPAVVRDFAVNTQTALDEWTQARLESLASDAGNKVMSELAASNESSQASAFSSPEITGLLSTKMNEVAAGELEIIECVPSFTRIPDFSLYVLAANTYAEYQRARSDLFARTSAEEADASVSEYLQIERFGRWGELLTKYPILIDFLAVTGTDAGQAFKAVREIRAK